MGVQNQNPNINTILGVSIATQDLLATNLPTLITRNVSGIVFPTAQATYYEYLLVQAIATTNLVPQPGTAIASVVFVRNVSPQPALVQVNISVPYSAQSFSMLLQNGAVFFSYSTPVGTTTASSGISTVTVQQSGNPGGVAEVFIAV